METKTAVLITLAALVLVGAYLFFNDSLISIIGKAAQGGGSIDPKEPDVKLFCSDDVGCFDKNPCTSEKCENNVCKYTNLASGEKPPGCPEGCINGRCDKPKTPCNPSLPAREQCFSSNPPCGSSAECKRQPDGSGVCEYKESKKCWDGSTCISGQCVRQGCGDDPRACISEGVKSGNCVRYACEEVPPGSGQKKCVSKEIKPDGTPCGSGGRVCTAGQCGPAPNPGGTGPQ